MKVSKIVCSLLEGATLAFNTQIPVWDFCLTTSMAFLTTQSLKYFISSKTMACLSSKIRPITPKEVDQMSTSFWFPCPEVSQPLKKTKKCSKICQFFLPSNFLIEILSVSCISFLKRAKKNGVCNLFVWGLNKKCKAASLELRSQLLVKQHTLDLYPHQICIVCHEQAHIT